MHHHNFNFFPSISQPTWIGKTQAAKFQHCPKWDKLYFQTHLRNISDKLRYRLFHPNSIFDSWYEWLTSPKTAMRQQAEASPNSYIFLFISSNNISDTSWYRDTACFTQIQFWLQLWMVDIAQNCNEATSGSKPKFIYFLIHIIKQYFRYIQIPFVSPRFNFDSSYEWWTSPKTATRQGAEAAAGGLVAQAQITIVLPNSRRYRSFAIHLKKQQASKKNMHLLIDQTMLMLR